MKKSIWLSSLTYSQDLVQRFMQQMKRYGLEVDGHFWEDDLEKLAWMKPREKLIEDSISLWAVLGSSQDLESESIRYGLSALCTTVKAKRGHGFPLIFVVVEGTIDPSGLPTPLKGVDVFSLSDPGLGPKMVAKVHGKSIFVAPEYRLDLYGNSQIGQWFEVGPHEGRWEGAMVGISEGEITFQAVGPKGKLPSTSILNYPMKGLKLSLGEQEYTAWAVKNPLDSETSYFVKIEGAPGSILFGSFSEDDQTDLFVYHLK